MEKEVIEYVDWKKVRYPKSYLATFVGEITKYSLSQGLIPSRCPICHCFVDRLVLHHWLGGSISRALLVGCCRRVCMSCNSSLGKIYRDGAYPAWMEQVFSLGYGRGEGWWSRVTVKEMDSWERWFEEQFRRDVDKGGYCEEI